MHTSPYKVLFFAPVAEKRVFDSAIRVFDTPNKTRRFDITRI